MHQFFFDILSWNWNKSNIKTINNDLSYFLVTKKILFIKKQHLSPLRPYMLLFTKHNDI